MERLPLSANSTRPGGLDGECKCNAERRRRAHQYKHAPIRVEPNERIRTWVTDDGPSENSAFHIVGTVFDTVYKEGAYQLRFGNGSGGAQVLDLQPAQGGFVEFSFAEAGLYPIVTHKFSNAGEGALGLSQAGEVQATGVGH